MCVDQCNHNEDGEEEVEEEEDNDDDDVDDEDDDDDDWVFLSCQNKYGDWYHHYVQENDGMNLFAQPWWLA